MPKTAARLRRTRHHSNLRPRHKHTKNYLKVYWPYMPLVSILLAIMTLISPWHFVQNRDVKAYATNISTLSLLRATNAERRVNGRHELTLNNKLSKAAQAKAEDMVVRNYWSHNTPENNAPWEFIIKAGYDYQKAGENLAYGFENSQQVINGWMNSKTHRENLLDEVYSEVGFGFANSDNFIGKGPSTVVVAMYARPVTQPITAQTFADNHSITSNHQVNTTSRSIGLAQTLFSLPWLPYALGFIAGSALTYLLFKHGIRVKRTIINGEKFIVKHPLLDVTLIAFVVLVVLLTREVGVIL